MVQQATRKPKVSGSNPDPAAARDKMTKKVFPVSQILSFKKRFKKVLFRLTTAKSKTWVRSTVVEMKVKRQNIFYLKLFQENLSLKKHFLL